MELVLHQKVQRTLASVLSRPAGSYLFYGPAGVGKFTTAVDVARRLNCRGDTGSQPCSSCAQFAAGSFPDLAIIQPADKPSITIDQIRQLVASLAMQPYYRNGTRVVVVAGAESLTTDAGNALLKLLEEPPPRTIFVLTAVAAEQLLPTVRSRCAAIYFPLPPRPQVVQLITARSGLSPAQAAQIADAASGAPGAALALAADPNHAQQQIQLAAQAEMTLHEHNRYLRLRQAAALATSPEATAHFARLLHRHLVETMRRPGTDLQSAGCSLAALERCRQQLAAKVAPKVALERLMLELS